MVIAERIRVVRAPNASPMTLEGTNTYLVDMGDGVALVIDPGPDVPAHLDAIVAEADAAHVRIAAIAVTHGHPDHAPGAAPLAARLGVPVYAHGAARFPHDVALADDEAIALGTRRAIALDTPGHTRDHLVFAFDDDGAMFMGDVVIGRGTVVVAPPAGDMRAYQHTLRRLRDRDPAARRLYGGHGDPVDDPRAKFDEYLAHREARERAILAALAGGTQTIAALVATIYRDVATALWPAAARQVDAYLIALAREGRVRARDLDRLPTADERAILTPDLSRLLGPEDAAVARAELGFDDVPEHIVTYELVS